MALPFGFMRLVDSRVQKISCPLRQSDAQCEDDYELPQGTTTMAKGTLICFAARDRFNARRHPERRPRR